MSGFAFTAATGNLQTDVAYGRETDLHDDVADSPKRVGPDEMQSTVECVTSAVKSRYSQNLGQARWCFDTIFGDALGAFQVTGLGAVLIAVFRRIRILQRILEQ